MKIPGFFQSVFKLRTLLRREEKATWIAITCFALLTSVFEILTATSIVVFAQVINQPDIGQNYLQRVLPDLVVAPAQAILIFAVLIALVYFIKNSIAAAEVFFQNFSIQRMNYNFKVRLLGRYAHADYATFMRRNSTYSASVVGGDSELIFSTGVTSLASILSESVVFVCLMAMIVFMNPSLALVAFGMGAIIALVVAKVLLPLYYFWGKHLQETSIYSNQNLYQFFHGFKDIILLGKSDYFVNAYKYYSYRRARVQALQAATGALPRIVIEVLFIVLFVGVIAFLCFRYDNPAMMMGIMGGYMYAGFRLMPGLNRIINQMNNFKAITPSIERVYLEFQDVARDSQYDNIPAFSFNKAIQISDVSYRYPETEDDVLRGISFDIAKGSRVGIIGETGSGKSTLVDVLLGLLLPKTGQILVDDQYTVHSLQWHKMIGYVPQAIYLIDDTIAANIAFGEAEVDQDKLKKAIRSAQLEALVSGLPEGVNTVVGERGMRLSGGERQRISIARALYHDPEVLIFDEATSALDNETEARLMATIDDISADRTVIMVAHRLTTLQKCDSIIVMNKGRVSDITNYDKIKGAM